MNAETYNQFFVFAGAGLALAAAGGVNLAFRKWCALRAVLSVGACAAVAGGLALLVGNAAALKAGGIALGALAAVTVLGSDWLARRTVAAGAALRTPGARWGFATLGGLLLCIAAGVQFDRADQAAMNETTREMELFTTRPHSHPIAGVRLATDLGSTVTAREPDEVRATAALTEPELRLLENGKHNDNVIRLGPADDRSNCHGWVFTGGKYILGPDDVELILKDNGYDAVAVPQPGDVVIYRSGAMVSHTAVVRYVSPGQPILVAGKWGVLGVFLHPVEKSCYGTEFTYYRSTRSGHVVAGANGTAPNTAGSATAE
jgi:hypothetical protein